MLGWLLLAAILVSHFAMHVTIYNRMNATGLPRWVIKLKKLFFLATCLTIPLLVLWYWPDGLQKIWSRELRWEEVPGILQVYGGLVLLHSAILGPHWFISRPALHSEAIPVERKLERQNVERAVGRQLGVTFKARLHSRLPWNQLFELAIETKELPVIGLPDSLDGLKIAHISDIHLTGHVSPGFYRYIIERANQWQPDLLAMTGDIVDKRKCIGWLEECFAHAQASYGCHFVLGNHDLRVKQPQLVRDELQRLGWFDLGGRTHEIVVRDERVELIGNESPWFPRPCLSPQASSLTKSQRNTRILLSHSPDQIRWARRHNVLLMLAGHTHGGQGRLPLIGPVLSPSYHGSRYASGTFYLRPTTLHVSRGLSGVHLMRINCPPELALLKLRAATP
jgi:predicted MPP superfamily phosphohydrolase